MYHLEQTQEIYRDSPWDKPYFDRIDKLKTAKKLGQKTVAFLYPKFDSSTFRYRGFNVAETLDYSLEWSGTCFQLEDLESLKNDINCINILVIIRCPWEERINEFIKYAKQRKVYLCYDIDDLIYNPKYMPSVVEALGLNQEFEWNFWFGLIHRNYMIAQMCDVTITTNDFLAQYLREDFDKPCFILKNYLNWMQEKVSTEYFEAKQHLESNNPFEIGYFSGSPTHVRDLALIMPEVEEFLVRHEDSMLKIVGYMELPKQYEKWVKKDRIRFVPFQSFIGLQYEQAKVDVNVVPLVNNVFSNCKSELKYFESAIVGTVTCATPSYTYANAIQNCDNGYLCNAGEWLDVFEKLYQEKENKQQQSYIREKALKAYAEKNQLQTVESILNDIVRS